MTMLGDAKGRDAELLRERLGELDRKYSLFADVLAVLLPAMEGPIDLERLIQAAPEGLVETVAVMLREVLAGPPPKQAASKARALVAAPKAPKENGRSKVERTDDRG